MLCAQGRYGNGTDLTYTARAACALGLAVRELAARGEEVFILAKTYSGDQGGWSNEKWEEMVSLCNEKYGGVKWVPQPRRWTAGNTEREISSVHAWLLTQGRAVGLDAQQPYRLTIVTSESHAARADLIRIELARAQEPEA